MGGMDAITKPILAPSQIQSNQFYSNRMRGGIYIYVQVNRKSICGTVRAVCHLINRRQ